jgi:tetratricopeptide (TPR) repeat protein
MFLVGQGWADEPGEVMAEAGRIAERAIVLDPQDAKALTIAGHVRAFLHHRMREALTLHDRALTLNPNLAMAWALSAMTFTYLGELPEAERREKRYKTLSPLDPHAFFYDTISIYIALLKRQFEEAASVGRAVTEMNPAFSSSLKPYLAALGHLGRIDECGPARERLLEIQPEFTIAAFIATSPFERQQDLDLVVAGLRAAGIPEG